ncbi:MAG: GNAT family N-acetyltransferase [Planctomycetota bacterium]|nr:GNAT family N-acetyltransferase [Planctomycetota bacterium]
MAKASSKEACHGFREAQQAVLTAPFDDMWDTFTNLAQFYLLHFDDKEIGYCAMNDGAELLAFYLEAAWEDRAEILLGELIESLKLRAACPSSVDPSFLSVALSLGQSAEPVALMYHSFIAPEGHEFLGLRLAETADHEAAVAFAETAIGAPRAFLEPYFQERIAKQELFLHEDAGVILASGELRSDLWRERHAHLGVIVHQEQRGKGLGYLMMHSLIRECQKRDFEPLCSTEPGNAAARRMIEKAGFRSRHRVFKIQLSS